MKQNGAFGFTLNVRKFDSTIPLCSNPRAILLKQKV